MEVDQSSAVTEQATTTTTTTAVEVPAVKPSIHFKMATGHKVRNSRTERIHRFASTVAAKGKKKKHIKLHKKVSEKSKEISKGQNYRDRQEKKLKYKKKKDRK